MKILHTADWHLGKRLERFSRLEEQREVLEEICEIAGREDPDAVVIAGDLFDAFNPPTEAIELFYRTAKKLSAEGRRAVVAIAGNHDSPDRIEAPDPLARECGIILTGYPHSRIAPFELESGLALRRSDAGFLELQLPACREPLRIIISPYANEVRLRAFLGFDDTEARQRELLAQQWRRLAELYCDQQGVNLLLAHLFMIRQGESAEAEPEDEKPILHVGGAQVIFAESIPAGIQYAALGHLHGKRQVADQPCPVFYSSSPLAYSMSEADQQKYVIMVEAQAGKAAACREIPLQKGKRLLRQRFQEVDQAVNWLQAHQNAWVELTMATDTYLTAGERRRIAEAHKGIVALIPILSSAETAPAGRSRRIDLQKSMEELFCDYFVSHQKQPPNEEILQLFREILAEDEE